MQRIADLGAFSGSVLLMRNDQVLLHRGYGLATDNPCVPAGAETVYHIGSLAKQFAATAALLLEERGRWRLTDPIVRFLPDVPADKQHITLHHLLTHTSGLPPDVVAYGAEHLPLHRDTLLAQILRAPLRSAPGATYAYSNAGYSLAAILIERAAGEPIQDFIERELFVRAGLSHTAFTGKPAALRGSTVASGFWGRYESPPPGRPASWALLPGEVLSTVGDMARWYNALRRGQVVSLDAVDRMMTPEAGDYGYGWHIRKRDDGSASVIFHNGDQGEYAIAFRHYPRSGLIAVAATNLVVQDAKQHDDVLNNALDVLAGEPVGLPAPGPSPAAVPVGTYRDGETVFNISQGSDGAFWLAPESPAAFRSLWSHVPESGPRADAAIRRMTAYEDSLAPTNVDCGAPPTGARNRTPTQYVSGWSRVRCDLVDELGEGVGAELIGVQPLSWSRTRALVFVRYTHARGTRVVTWLWDGDRPVEAWQAPSVTRPQAVRMASSVDGHLVFDWFTGAIVRVRFVRSPAGELQIRLESDGTVP